MSVFVLSKSFIGFNISGGSPIKLEVRPIGARRVNTLCIRTLIHRDYIFHNRGFLLPAF